MSGAKKKKKIPGLELLQKLWTCQVQDCSDPRVSLIWLRDSSQEATMGS